MSTANDLIERAERESGKRIDDPDNQIGIALLFGALAREMGRTNFEAKDDVAAGLVIMDEIANGQKRQQDQQLLAGLLSSGLSPDDVKALLGK